MMIITIMLSYSQMYSFKTIQNYQFIFIYTGILYILYILNKLYTPLDFKGQDWDLYQYFY